MLYATVEYVIVPGWQAEEKGTCYICYILMLNNKNFLFLLEKNFLNDYF